MRLGRDLKGLGGMQVSTLPWRLTCRSTSCILLRLRPKVQSHEQMPKSLHAQAAHHPSPLRMPADREDRRVSARLWQLDRARHIHSSEILFIDEATEDPSLQLDMGQPRRGL